MEKEKLIKNVTAIHKWSSNLLQSLKGLQDLPDEDEAQALASLSQLILKKATSVNEAFGGNSEAKASEEQGPKQDSAKFTQLENELQQKAEEIQQLNQNLVRVEGNNNRYEKELKMKHEENNKLKSTLKQLEADLSLFRRRSIDLELQIERQARENEEYMQMRRELEDVVNELQKKNASLEEKLEHENRNPEA